MALLLSIKVEIYTDYREMLHKTDRVCLYTIYKESRVWDKFTGWDLHLKFVSDML